MVVVESRLVRGKRGRNPFHPTVLRCTSAPEFGEMGLGGRMRGISALEFGEMGLSG